MLIVICNATSPGHIAELIVVESPSERLKRKKIEIRNLNLPRTQLKVGALAVSKAKIRFVFKSHLQQQPSRLCLMSFCVNFRSAALVVKGVYNNNCIQQLALMSLVSPCP